MCFDLNRFGKRSVGLWGHDGGGAFGSTSGARMTALIGQECLCTYIISSSFEDSRKGASSAGAACRDIWTCRATAAWRWLCGKDSFSSPALFAEWRVVLFQRLMRREDMEIKIDIEVFAQLSWPCLSHRHVAESRARVGARRHCSAQVTVPGYYGSWYKLKKTK